VLPGELAKHAVSEGTKAVTKYTTGNWNCCTLKTALLRATMLMWKGVRCCLLASVMILEGITLFNVGVFWLFSRVAIGAIADRLKGGRSRVRGPIRWNFKFT
jgi:hypothetical protein